ncbi:MAG TPA: DUF1328 domain-containing protein [Bryobacteraceae bacterium]
MKSSNFTWQNTEKVTTWAGERPTGEAFMLGWAFAFVAAALIVALLGVSDTATTFGEIAKVLFWVFIIGFVFSLVMHFSRTRA